MALLKADCVDWLALTCNFAVNNYICFRLKYWIKRPDNGCILNIGLFLDNFDTVWNFLSSFPLLKKTELLTDIVLKTNELSSSSLNRTIRIFGDCSNRNLWKSGLFLNVHWFFGSSSLLWVLAEQRVATYRTVSSEKQKSKGKLTFICNTSVSGLTSEGVAETLLFVSPRKKVEETPYWNKVSSAWPTFQMEGTSR